MARSRSRSSWTPRATSIPDIEDGHDASSIGAFGGRERNAPASASRHARSREGRRGSEEQARRHSESPADDRRPCRSPRLQHGVRSAVLQLRPRARLGAARNSRRLRRSRFTGTNPSSRTSCGPELQYVVVKDREQASAALAIVKDVTKGRLDCLVLNGETPLQTPEAIDGATPLFDVVRFDERVKHFANYFRERLRRRDRGPGMGTWPTDTRTAALSPRTGEVVRGHVVSWGEHEALGPLSLKREIRELDRQMDTRRSGDGGARSRGGASGRSV